MLDHQELGLHLGSVFHPNMEEAVVLELLQNVEIVTKYSVVDHLQTCHPPQYHQIFPSKLLQTSQPQVLKVNDQRNLQITMMF